VQIRPVRGQLQQQGLPLHQLGVHLRGELGRLDRVEVPEGQRIEHVFTLGQPSDSLLVLVLAG